MHVPWSVIEKLIDLYRFNPKPAEEPQLPLMTQVFQDFYAYKLVSQRPLEALRLAFEAEVIALAKESWLEEAQSVLDTLEADHSRVDGGTVSPDKGPTQ